VETVVSFKVGRLPLQDGKLQGVLPDVLQKTLSEAEAMIVTAGFTIGRVQYRYSTSLVPNTVIAQSPKQGELAPLGKPVDLVVSTNDKEKEKEQPWTEVEDDTVSVP
jgi:serine/threonine-protein kinase